VSISLVPLRMTVFSAVQGDIFVYWAAATSFFYWRRDEVACRGGLGGCGGGGFAAGGSYTPGGCGCRAMPPAPEASGDADGEGMLASVEAMRGSV